MAHQVLRLYISMHYGRSSRVQVFQNICHLGKERARLLLIQNTIALLNLFEKRVARNEILDQI